MPISVKHALKVLLICLTEADLIPDEDVVVTLTMQGYVKRVLLKPMACSIVVVKAKWV